MSGSCLPKASSAFMLLLLHGWSMKWSNSWRIHRHEKYIKPLIGDTTIISLQPIFKDFPFTLEHVTAGKKCLKQQESAITISKDTFKNHHPCEQWKGLTLIPFRILHSSNQEACWNNRQGTPTDLTGLGRQCNSWQKIPSRKVSPSRQT